MSASHDRRQAGYGFGASSQFGHGSTGIATILAIFVGAIWSWYQFSIGDLLRPNFTLKVALNSVSELASSRLLVFRVTVENIGRTTVRHADSKLRIFPIYRSEVEKLEEQAENPLHLSPIPGSREAKDVSSRLWKIKRQNDPGRVIDHPFSQVHVIPQSWNRPDHPYGEYPFVLRPGEEVRTKAQYGVHFQRIFDLSVPVMRPVPEQSPNRFGEIASGAPSGASYRA